MRLASAVTTKPDGPTAVADLFDQLAVRLDPAEADFALFFCTAHYEDEIDQTVAELQRRIPTAVLVGCSAEGTIGADREHMDACSMSILAGSMPGVDIRPFRLTLEELHELDDPQDWADAFNVDLDADEKPLIVALGDPFSFDVQTFLDQANDAFPEVPIVGGMASAAEAPEQNSLVLGSRVFSDGLVGLTMSGGFHVRTVVSQGCRPIGKPFVVTAGERNVIAALGGIPAMNALRDVVKELPQKDLVLAQQALFMGRVINEYQESFSRGDFLINSIIGFDPNSGSIAVSAPVKVGTTVQFQVRDAASADEDLRTLLDEVASTGQDPDEPEPAGAMLFSCNGRGTRMWPHQPAHDVTVLRETHGDIPVAGFFAAGEIGPVGGRNFIHGFTASIALLSPT
jgi:small ligand-binding sensory domain FIST